MPRFGEQELHPVRKARISQPPHFRAAVRLILASSSAAMASSRVTLGKSSQKLAEAPFVLQIVRQRLKRHARPAKYRLTAENRWIPHDNLGCHSLSPQPQCSKSDARFCL